MFGEVWLLLLLTCERGRMVQVYVRAVNTSGDINAVLFGLSSDGSSQHPLWNLPSSMLLLTVWCELLAHNTL